VLRILLYVVGGIAALAILLALVLYVWWRVFRRLAP